MGLHGVGFAAATFANGRSGKVLMRLPYLLAAPVLVAAGVVVAPIVVADCTTVGNRTTCSTDTENDLAVAGPAAPYPCFYDAYFCNDGYNWFTP